MPSRDKAIDNRIHDVMMRCEKLAASRANFNSDLVSRRNQRRPRLRHVGLAGHSDDEPIDHCPHGRRICPVVLDCIRIAHGIHDRRRGHRLRGLRKSGSGDAEKNKTYVSHRESALAVATDFMSNSANHNWSAVVAAGPSASSAVADDAPATVETIRHLYVHIPFCARICPYCSFYKDLLDRSQTSRFCEAILRELVGTPCYGVRSAQRADPTLGPSTIYFGGGTPTALGIAQLELLLRGFRERLDLSQLVEWTMEPNAGSV